MTTIHVSKIDSLYTSYFFLYWAGTTPICNQHDAYRDGFIGYQQWGWSGKYQIGEEESVVAPFISTEAFSYKTEVNNCRATSAEAIHGEKPQGRVVMGCLTTLHL